MDGETNLLSVVTQEDGSLAFLNLLDLIDLPSLNSRLLTASLVGEVDEVGWGIFGAAFNHGYPVEVLDDGNGKLDSSLAPLDAPPCPCLIS